MSMDLVPSKSELQTMAVAINEHHTQVLLHARSALESAKASGELLLQAKALLPHGQWLPWLEENCQVSPRQAQRYMLVADRWEAIAKNDAASYLTIDEAIRESESRSEKHRKHRELVSQIHAELPALRAEWQGFNSAERDILVCEVRSHFDDEIATLAIGLAMGDSVPTGPSKVEM
jgi:hypothetical protein